MQRRVNLFWILALFIVALVVTGCRVESAGEDKDPTPRRPGEILVNNDIATVDPNALVPTQEVNGDDLTRVAQDFTATLTPTSIASSTPTVDVQLGQGGFTGDLATFTQQPSPTNTQPFIPTEVVQFIPSSSTPTYTLTYTPTNTPTNTPTDTPTATNTPTNTPTDTPTDTPTATFTPTTTLTLAPVGPPTATPTITLFPAAIGGGPSDPTLVAQAGGSPTPNDPQLTATQIIVNATIQAGGQVGTTQVIPTIDPNAISGQGGQIGPTATGFPDCTITIPPDISLSEIARQYNLDTDVLAAYNNITNPDYIRAGDDLNIPGCGLNPTATPTVNPAATNGTVNQPVYDNSVSQIIYVVVEGDSIYELSERFGVTMTQIITLNAIADINLLSVGQQLVIPPRSRIATTATPTPTPGITG